MKEQILKVLNEHPEGMRLRAIDAHTWLGRMKILDTLIALEAEGIVESRPAGDPANMEYYNLWFVCNKEA